MLYLNPILSHFCMCLGDAQIAVVPKPQIFQITLGASGDQGKDETSEAPRMQDTRRPPLSGRSHWLAAPWDKWGLP